MNLQVNEWTRTHDDKCRYQFEKNASERPLRYITRERQNIPDEHTELGYYTTPTHVASQYVDKDSELRPTMTHLNEIQNLETRDFATIPYMGSGELLGNNDFANVNSDMRGNASRLHGYETGRVQVENYIPGFLDSNPQKDIVYPSQWVVGGRSTRNDMRELYKDVCK